MRPVCLELQGFGAFRDLAVVDFTDADFFALVGPTGSGKSTVLDAMCFALYGNVPRYDDQRLVGAAMSLGANEARVRFTFEVGGDRYVVARVVRRGAQSKVSTKEARLERVADGVVLAGRESELRAAVEAVIGLSFDDFTRCVVLPQGSFARFLHDKPADRQALLVRLLELGVYSRLMNRANARAAEHQRELDHLAGQLSELPRADEGELVQLDERRRRLAGLNELLGLGEPRYVELDAELVRLQDAVTQSERILAALRAVEPPTWLADHGAKMAAAAAAVVEAERTAEDARARLGHAEATLDSLPQAAAVEQALVAHERMAKGRVVIAERAALVAAARQHAERSELERRAAEAEVVEASEHQRELERAHRAHALAVLLEPGEPCPVCEQVVTRLPLPVTPPGLDDALSRATAAADRAAAARAAAEAARATVAATEAQWNTAVTRLEELRSDTVAWPDPEVARRVLSEVHTARQVLLDARDAAHRSTEQAAASRRVVDELTTRLTGLTASFHEQRDPLVDLGPPSPTADLAVAWPDLATWAARQVPIVQARLLTDRATADSIRHEARTLLAELTEAFVRVEVDLPEPRSMAALRTAITRAEAEIEQRLVVLARAAARRAELEVAVRVATEGRSVAHELARQLKTDRFQRWLVEAAFEQLAVRASEILLRLSNDQFSLTMASGGEFAVIDHTAAEEERSVRTLSGGETFQASLALALSLSEHVIELAGARGQRALESIFLDEGFGTLDPDSLETVAATIESLGDDGRMVGIVTHVKELADRVPVQYRVTKGPRTAVIERIEI